MEQTSTKICYILAYKAPNYIRTITILEALKLIPNIQLYEARNTSKGVVRYIQTIIKLIKIRLKHSPDVYILGFRGNEIFWPVRLLTIGKPLIFDEMMSPYDAVAHEGKAGNIAKLISPVIYLIEKSIFKFSNLIITDTNLHKEYFAQLFSTAEGKIASLPVGTDERLFHPIEPSNRNKEAFRVFFYSSFQPLHGLDIIVKAAKLLEDLPIEIMVVGGKGKRLQEFENQIDKLNVKNIKHTPWIDFKELPQVIADSDICLGGPFGNTGQAQRVITGKTYQFIAMGKATLIGQINMEAGFKDKYNSIIVQQGNPQSLAQGIKWAYNNQDQLSAIGKRGKQLYDNNFSIKCISKQLHLSIERVLHEKN